MLDKYYHPHFAWAAIPNQTLEVIGPTFPAELIQPQQLVAQLEMKHGLITPSNGQEPPVLCQPGWSLGIGLLNTKYA